MGKARLTLQQFIEKAKQKHGDLYDYSKTKYLNSRTKVAVVCRKHGEFFQTPNNHLRGKRCPSCNNEGWVKTTELMIAKFKKIHDDRYDYSRAEYKGVFIPVEIICKTHGVFVQQPNHHYEGKGCQLCGKDIMGPHLKTTQEFIADAQKVHGDRYSYEKTVYKRSIDNVIVTCHKHGDFVANANHHLNGRNCPRCAKAGRSEIADKWLDSLGITEREYRIPGTKYKVDGYDSQNKICYEFLGVYFHGHPDFFDPEDINPTNKRKFGDLYRETFERIEEIKSLGYGVVIKWEDTKRWKMLVNRS